MIVGAFRETPLQMRERRRGRRESRAGGAVCL